MFWVGVCGMLWILFDVVVVGEFVVLRLWRFLLLGVGRVVLSVVVLFVVCFVLARRFGVVVYINLD